ncbi:50S ribosomal protein L11 methyltransferase [Allosphingosinicella sp.]|uniref:50S ribosomal protein L11 methyltransferase n=1 Tax=Allosphingosinicella sp. TaxID=2823234 RepID=UPI002F009D71
MPCTKEEAERIAWYTPDFPGDEPPPVLATCEPDPARPEQWRLDAYFEREPDSAALAVLSALAPSAGAAPSVDALADENWVTLSQQGLEPIRAGRFFVHTADHRGEVPAEAQALEIDAGRAFGTGHHETTAGCLIALDRLKQAGLAFDNILDLGTGTGLLAFAALRLWPAARGTASDIDLVAIDVAAANAAVNGIPLGAARGQVELIAAPGLDEPLLQTRAPYDLVVANILAGPLVELAPSVAEAMAPGARLVLAGLLTVQVEEVAAAYRRQGLTAAFRIDRGDWAILAMRKRKALGWR